LASAGSAKARDDEPARLQAHSVQNRRFGLRLADMIDAVVNHADRVGRRHAIVDELLARKLRYGQDPAMAAADHALLQPVPRAE